MANGAKFSQVGVDISRASDHEMHFDSEWPTVHMLRGGHQSNTIISGDIFYEHKLGFVPAFIPFIYNSIDQSYEIFRTILTVDKQNIYWYVPGGGGGGIASVEYGLFIYNIDIEKNYKAPSNNPSPKTQGGDEVEFGIKFTTDSGQIRSKNMQDYKVNTSARAPLVHAVSYGLATESGSTSVLKNYSYTHNLPYNPMFLPFVEVGPTFSGSTIPSSQYLLSSNFAGLNTSGNTITLKDIHTGYHGSIVVLKDPFDASENTTLVTI